MATKSHGRQRPFLNLMRRFGFFPRKPRFPQGQTRRALRAVPMTSARQAESPLGRLAMKPRHAFYSAVSSTISPSAKN